MKKNIILVGGVVIVLILGIIGFNYTKFKGTSANPDYICVKSVTNQPCKISSCGNWQIDGTRTCYGKRATEVSYYLIRTTCEAGYTQISAGGNVGGSSGRQGADYVSQTESCSVVEVDNKAPEGEVK